MSEKYITLTCRNTTAVFSDNYFYQNARIVLWSSDK